MWSHYILQYLRWYIDGVLLYEINKQALVAQTNGTGKHGLAPPATHVLPQSGLRILPTCTASSIASSILSCWLCMPPASLLGSVLQAHRLGSA